MKALCFDQFGGPEVLALRDVADPEPRRGHAIVRLQAIGLNFADIYRRRGNYTLEGRPPYIAGYEGAGIVESLHGGEDPSISAGSRVGFADSPFANAELVSVPIEKLIPLPADIGFETAAAVLLQGLTAYYLTHDSHPIRPGEHALVHAAAGGVGLLLTQISKLGGGKVIGVTSSRTKAEAALEAGADHVAFYDEDWVAAARKYSRDGRGVDVVYDSVGATLRRSLDAARIGGRVVFYGMAGGDPQPIEPRVLMNESKTLTGGDLWNVLRTAEDRRRLSEELFKWVRAGKLKIRIAKTFPLSEGSKAHAYLESRSAIGKVLLLPGRVAA